MPQEYESIQIAIDISQDGDTVLVSPGIYSEQVTIEKNITLLSTGGYSDTIIEGFTVSIVDTYQVEINGFTIRGNYYGDIGGGLFIESSNDVLLKNLNIYDNFTYDYGGGINSRFSNIVLEKSLVHNNHTDYIIGWDISCGGAGISLLLSNLFVFHSFVGFNTINNISPSNFGCEQISGGIDNIGAEHPVYSDVTITNSIVFFNNGTSQINEVNLNEIYSYSNIQDSDWTINADPLFIDAENHDFRLHHDSPCIDAGHPDSPLDPDGTIADIGPFYFNQDCANNGDMNEDNLINVLDIVMIVDFILNTTIILDYEVICKVDMNNDYNVNILDVVSIVSIIMEM